MDEETIVTIKNFLSLMSKFDEEAKMLKKFQNKNIQNSNELLKKDSESLEKLIDLQTDIIETFLDNHETLIDIMQIQLDLIEILDGKELFDLYVNFVKALEAEDYIKCEDMKKKIIEYEKDED